MSEIERVSFNIPAFVASTMRLNTEAKGAYLMLLLDYYQNQEGCLVEDDIIMEVTGLSAEAWKRHRRVIMPLFTIRDGRLWHQRCEDEIALIQTRRYYGRHGGRQSATKRATKPQAEPQPEANQEPNQTANQTPTKRPTNLQPISNQTGNQNGNQEPTTRARAAVSKKEEEEKERKKDPLRFATGVQRKKDFAADAATRPKPRLVVSSSSAKTPLPADWTPNDNNAAVAAAEGYQLDQIAQHFRDVCGANGYRYANHHQAFSNFIRNQKNFNRGRSYGQTQTDRSLVAAGERAISELDRQIGELEALEGRHGGGDAVVQVVSEK